MTVAHPYGEVFLDRIDVGKGSARTSDTSKIGKKILVRRRTKTCSRLVESSTMAQTDLGSDTKLYLREDFGPPKEREGENMPPLSREYARTWGSSITSTSTVFHKLETPQHAKST